VLKPESEKHQFSFKGIIFLLDYLKALNALHTLSVFLIGTFFPQTLPYEEK